MATITDSAVRFQNLVEIGSLYLTDGPYPVEVTTPTAGLQTFDSTAMISNIDSLGVNYFANGQTANITFSTISETIADTILGYDFLNTDVYIYRMISDPVDFSENTGTIYRIFDGYLTGMSQTRNNNNIEIAVSIGNELTGFEVVNGRFTTDFNSQYNFDNVEWGS